MIGAAVRPLECVGQDQCLTLGQEVERFATRVKVPAQVVQCTRLGRVGRLPGQAEHGFQGVVANRVGAGKAAAGHHRVQHHRDRVGQVGIGHRQCAAAAQPTIAFSQCTGCAVAAAQADHWCIVGASHRHDHVLRGRATVPIIDCHRVGSRDRLARCEEVKGRVCSAKTPGLRATAAARAVDLGAQRKYAG